MHSRFEQILHLCTQQGVAVTLNTHGVLAEAVVVCLLEAPVERYLVSVDGSERSHEALRGRGTFRRTVETCRRLRQADKAVTLSCHLGRHNARDVSAVADLAADLGADLKLTPLRPLGRAALKMPDAFLQPPDFLAIMRQLGELRRTHRGVRIMADFDILDREHEVFAVTDALAACGAGRLMASIAADGDVLPCAFFVTSDRRFVAGNLHRNTLQHIWRTSPVFEPFRVHSKAPACQSCRHYRSRCAGGCPAVAYLQTGVLDAADPTCFAHLVAGDET